MAQIEMNPDNPLSKTDDDWSSRYSRYRLAKAEYERAIYSSAVCGEDTPDELVNPFSDAHDDALLNYMASPARKFRDLVRKIETFQEEGLQSHTKADMFVAQLVHDAHELSYALDR